MVTAGCLAGRRVAQHCLSPARLSTPHVCSMKGAHGEPDAEAGPAGMGVPIQLAQCCVVTRAHRSELPSGRADGMARSAAGSPLPGSAPAWRLGHGSEYGHPAEEWAALGV